MIYLLIFIEAIIVSIIVKMYLYPIKSEESISKWFSYLKFRENPMILIDIFLVLTHVFLFKKYSFSISFFTYIALSSILLTVSIVDIRAKIIPDKVMILGIALGTVIMFLNDNISFINALLGLVVCGGIIAIISTITKGAVGMGDAKLFACIGLFLGLQNTLGVMVMATMLSGLTGLILLTFKVANRKTTIPFAPFISAAAIFIMVFN
ncbi:A24 family peptidase [Wukongibacter baidiensis]|uniref:prepilin peptidase n=1 Tax=Wukongibacter baidiensis TaxID=1723361 RepID=UPI003D7FFDFB